MSRISWDEYFSKIFMTTSERSPCERLEVLEGDPITWRTEDRYLAELFYFFSILFISEHIGK